MVAFMLNGRAEGLQQKLYGLQASYIYHQGLFEKILPTPGLEKGDFYQAMLTSSTYYVEYSLLFIYQSNTYCASSL